MDNNYDRERLELLLKTASSRLNMDATKLRSQLQKGAFDDAISRMNSNQSATLNNVLSNPKALEEMLNSPKVKNLLSELMKKKDSN